MPTYLPPPPGHLEERRAVYARWADSLARVGKLDVEGHLEPPGNVVDGLFIIRAANDSDAARIAATCPHIKYRGHIQVRRFLQRSLFSPRVPDTHPPLPSRLLP